ncbi:MAG: circularly permuted type 2 ATP-grasp protein, partial [Lautropia sp.]
HWQPLLQALTALGNDELARRFATADRYLKEAGVFYRVYGEAGGADRTLSLAHMPLLLPGAEWERLSAGLIERAELLETVARDLYGPRRLIADGALPAAVVTGNAEYLRPMIDAAPADSPHLWFYAADLGRAPDGRWWVLGDRTQAPSGAGYALENRVAMSRAFPNIFRQLNVERLAGFFEAFRDALAVRTRSGSARVGLLTPGGMNETYYEHAYLARYLGFLLVEGGDLVVRDDLLHVRTIHGLRPLDVLFRRLDSSFADPLELRAESTIGVAGLLQAVRSGQLTVANALGSGVLESRAMLSFMPALARRLLGRELRLPNIATWWCGQPQERARVLASLDAHAIAPAFAPGLPGLLDAESVSGAEIDPRRRARVVEAIERRGIDFVGQEIVKLSTMPVWDDGRLVPRPLILRVYVTRTQHGWRVMPGAFCRVSHDSDARAVSMQKGGRSADVWVLRDAPVEATTLLPSDDAVVRRTLGTLPSRAADNIYWLGRYVERIELMLRVLRAYVVRIAERVSARNALHDELTRAMVSLGVVAIEDAPAGPLELARRALAWPGSPLSIASTVQRAYEAAGRIRDRFAPDAWRALRDLTAILAEPAPPTLTELEISDRIGNALRTVSAFSGLVQENMTRLAAWRFLEIGRRLERALGTARLIRRFAAAPTQETSAAAAESLDALLELADSVISYRQRYSITATRSSIVDLVGLDPNNPRSIAFQTALLVEHLEALAERSASDEPSEPLARAILIAAEMRATPAHRFGDQQLGALDDALLALSDAITQTYLVDRSRLARPVDPL